MKMKAKNRATARQAPATGAGRSSRMLLAATATMGLLVAGCAGSSSSSDGSHGGKGSSHGSDPATTEPALKYSECMRRHGVPDFPNPVEGHIQLQPGDGIEPGSPALQAAEKACQASAPQGAPGRGAQPGPSAKGTADWHQFGGWLQGRASAGKFSGAVLVTKDGKPVLRQADGQANLERGIANNLNTKFNIGSVGKTFTAIAVAQLVEQGKLSFTAPIDKYISAFPPQVGEQITVAELLTHTSGLGDVFARWHPATSPLDLSSVMKRIISEPLQFQPGTRFSYSNSGFVVLGAIIEAVTGENYYDYVRSHVFAPAGMSHTGWYTLDQVPNMAHGYIPTVGPAGAVSLRDSHGAGGAGNPSGGAYSTLGDLSRFAQALLDDRLLSPALTSTVLTGKVETRRPGAPTKYAYGFEEETVNGVQTLGHGGGAPGIEAQFRIYPKLGYTIIVLANEEAAAMPVYERINEMLT